MSGTLSTFSVVETHGRAMRPGNQLVADSQDVGWRSMHAAILVEAPFEATEPAIGHPSFIYHVSRPTNVTRRIEGGAPEQALIVPRRICVTPGQSTARWQHAGRPKILQVYVRQAVLESAMSELFAGDAASTELVPRFAILDPLLEQLAISLIRALHEQTRGDQLYIDTVAQMIAVHLAREYASRSRRRRRMTGTVAMRRMGPVIDFIEEHISDDLSLETLAGEAGISPIYFARAFKSAVGQSPHQYVLARRLDCAKELLRRGDLPVVEVAAAAGFSSQGHLSYWMVRTIGVSPGAYRRESGS